jgi:DHA1 family bicyclomycin/chloramphenicol resistance-like MFS transporter
MHAAKRAPSAAPPIILLGIASGLSPFGVTIAVPILADMARQFSAGFGQVQWLISIYLFGLGLAQPFNGFLCDRFGRRPVMLGGFSLFVAASVAAAFTTSLNALIALRLLQAMGVSVGTVASRAVVRDTHDARGSTVALSYIAATMGFAPILAPVIGGWLGDRGGYTTVFLVTALLGAFILAMMWRTLPETLHPERARPRWADWMRNYRMLFGSGMFMAHSLIFGFKQGSFFAFLAVGAVVFETHFGIGQGDFGLLWGSMAFTYVAGAIISARLTRRLDPRPVMHVAILATLLGGWGILFGVWLQGLTLPGLLIPLALLMTAAGTVTPVALAGAVNAHPDIAGTASGLSSAIGIVVGGAFTVVSGYLYDGVFMPVAWLIAVAASLSSLSWVWVCLHRP